MWPSSLTEQGQVNLQPVSIPMYAAQPYGASTQAFYPPMAAAATEIDSWAVAQAAAAQRFQSVQRLPSPQAHVQPHIPSPHTMTRSLVASPQHHVVHGHAIPQNPSSPAFMMTWHPPHLAMPGVTQQESYGLAPVPIQPVYMPNSNMGWPQQRQQQQHDRCFVGPGLTHPARQRQPQQPRSTSRAERFRQLSTKPGDICDAAVEEFVWSVKKTPVSEMLNKQMVEEGLQNLDSRGLAALLKDLAKGRYSKRAREVFDYLRSLPADNPLAGLCDVFTYTAMVSLCVDQQELTRALELVQEMKQRKGPHERGHKMWRVAQGPRNLQ